MSANVESLHGGDCDDEECQHGGASSMSKLVRAIFSDLRHAIVSQKSLDANLHILSQAYAVVKARKNALDLDDLVPLA